MKTFKELARKNLSEKFQGNRMLGTLALNAVKAYFHLEKKSEHIVSEEIISGYLRYHLLFLKTTDQALKISIFKEKKKLIEMINSQFSKMGYSHNIDDIRLK